ncbi:hypothetical protein, partial [Bilophila wadsworthia]|uniref:hypothetical protein n=1 Tax=Bilophila wadsworthia TaxID=35833 RepID=UPI0032C0CF50
DHPPTVFVETILLKTTASYLIPTGHGLFSVFPLRLKRTPVAQPPHQSTFLRVAVWGKALFIKNAFPQIPPQKDSIWNSPANRLDN